MEVRSVTRLQNLGVQSARSRGIQPHGLDALIFAVCPKKAARIITKTLKSAIANAEHNNN